jgi:lipoprotein-anchoring transpeptidase ErfK/SrfK
MVRQVTVSSIPITTTLPPSTAAATDDRASVGNEAGVHSTDGELIDPNARVQVIGGHEEWAGVEPTLTEVQVPGQIYAGPSSDDAPQDQTSPAATPMLSMPISSPASPSEVGEGRWIDVDLTRQMVTAYEGTTPVRAVTASTGLPNTPTPVGQFRIWVKFRYDDMEGPGYYLRDVPYTMYFHGGYGLHGTYWHSNFGRPMSHGCVNLPTPEAEWLFHWAEVGTLVNVHN